MSKNGHCLCKKIQFSYRGDENWRGHCHCESCRRQTASPFTTFMGIDHNHWQWTAAQPAVYESSPGVKRYFCDQCGAPVAYESTKYPHEIHFYASLLEDHSDFQPDKEFHKDEKVNWVSLEKDLQT
ncbi:MAG: GFA family protein [Acidiferrobacterales bacterium]|nr:GFA family protein [Acidiferrobacterales bacterium]